MTTKARIIAPVFAAAAVATVIAAAPVLPRQPHVSVPTGLSRPSAEPGNAEVRTEQPRVQPPRIYGEYESPLPFLFN